MNALNTVSLGGKTIKDDYEFQEYSLTNNCLKPVTVTSSTQEKKKRLDVDAEKYWSGIWWF